MSPPHSDTILPRPRIARSDAASFIVTTGVAAGLLTGVLHGLVLFVRHFGLGQFTWYSRDFYWMAPVNYALLNLAGSVPLLAIALIRPRWARPSLVLGTFVTVMVFALLLPFTQISRLASLLLSAGFAAQVARKVASHADVRQIVRRALFALALIVTTVGAGTTAWRWREASATPWATATTGAPNVLLIILDTVRAASLSLYGYPYPTTPTLERLAAQGTTFDWAFAPSPWTLPSHASMFTGLDPVRLAADWNVPLEDSVAVVAEAFQRQGFHTAGIAANLDYTTWDSGLARGFTFYRAYTRSWTQLLRSSSYGQTPLVRRLLNVRSFRDLEVALSDIDLSIPVKHADAPRRANNVTSEFLDWHESHTDRPFFAFLNYFDAHQSYFAPEGFPAVGGGSPAHQRYTTAIRWIDHNLDSLFRTLEARGVLDRTLVIVTSDHGELFQEHGLNGHAHNLYRNVLHVPLLMRFPGVVPAGRRVSRQVSLRDLAATLTDLGGLRGESFPGTSLRQAWLDDGVAVSEVFGYVRRAPNVSNTYPTSHSALVAAFDDSLQYIRHLNDTREETYAYRSDSLVSPEQGPVDASVLLALRAAAEAYIRIPFPPPSP